MKPRTLYACIAVHEFPAQAMLRLRPELRAEPCAVLDGTPPLETVCSLNARAHRLGIAQNMTRVEAETFPATLLARTPSEEQSARSALLCIRLHHSDAVSKARIYQCSSIRTFWWKTLSKPLSVVQKQKPFRLLFAYHIPIGIAKRAVTREEEERQRECGSPQLICEYFRTMLPKIDAVYKLRPRSIVSLLPDCAWALSPISPASNPTVRSFAPSIFTQI